MNFPFLFFVKDIYFFILEKSNCLHLLMDWARTNNGLTRLCLRLHSSLKISWKKKYFVWCLHVKWHEILPSIRASMPKSSFRAIGRNWISTSLKPLSCCSFSHAARVSSSSVLAPGLIVLTITPEEHRKECCDISILPICEHLVNLFSKRNSNACHGCYIMQFLLILLPRVYLLFTSNPSHLIW